MPSSPFRIAAFALILALGCSSGSTDSEEDLDSSVASYVARHEEFARSFDGGVDGFAAHVREFCEDLYAADNKDVFLVEAAGPDYWFWSSDADPESPRNAPDEVFEMTEACRYEATGTALELGVGYFDDTPAQPSVPTDPLDQMAIAFDGNHTREEIEGVIIEAMRRYDMAVTNDNLSRAGSVLVEMRRSFGPSEMLILDHMVRSHVPGVELSFADAAALSTTALVAGDE